jgi:hypothetical protein
MKEESGNDHLALAWKYPGQEREVIPAKFSLVTYTCAKDASCGAILDTWTGISGTSITDLIGFTNNFIREPNNSTRLTSTLEVPINAGANYGSRMKGWLRPPVTGVFNFFIAANDNGEFWLSTDSNPANKVRVCYTPGPVGQYFFTAYSEQMSSPIPLNAEGAYYFEVRE